MFVWFDHPSFPGKMMVSRVIGVPGDRIAIRGGKVFRDGKELTEEYAAKLARDEAEEIVVPADHIYVLNDARRATGSPGADSRRLGPIPVGSIVGTSGDPEDATRGGARKGKS
jgi:signal peptidase I